MKKITVVTVNYNTDLDTHNFLKSLEKSDVDGLNLSIIVVDNGSKNIFKLNDDEKKDHIRLIRSENNMGFSGGFNIGMKEAIKNDADFILIVNNDTLVEQSMIKNLLSILESKDNIGVTVPKIYFAKGHEYHIKKYTKEELGKVFWYAGGYTDWSTVTSVHRGVDEVDHGQYDTTEKVTFATGCCMMFKTEALIKTGLFDERYFLYYEDADLTERLKRNRYEIFYVPKAVLAHVNASSSGGAGNTLQDYFISRNRMLFGMTYAPIRTKLALIRESIRLLIKGRNYQKIAIKDFYLGRFNKGSYFDR